MTGRSPQSLSVISSVPSLLVSMLASLYKPSPGPVSPPLPEPHAAYDSSPMLASSSNSKVTSTVMVYKWQAPSAKVISSPIDQGPAPINIEGPGLPELPEASVV